AGAPAQHQGHARLRELTPPHLRARDRVAPYGDAQLGLEQCGGQGERGRCAADVVAHPPILLSTSESAPKSRRSAQSRGVGRKATQLRRIRSATSLLEISGFESRRMKIG